MTHPNSNKPGSSSKKHSKKHSAVGAHNQHRRSGMSNPHSRPASGKPHSGKPQSNKPHSNKKKCSKKPSQIHFGSSIVIGGNAGHHKPESNSNNGVVKGPRGLKDKHKLVTKFLLVRRPKLLIIDLFSTLIKPHFIDSILKDYILSDGEAFLAHHWANIVVQGDLRRLQEQSVQEKGPSIHLTGSVTECQKSVWNYVKERISSSSNYTATSNESLRIFLYHVWFDGLNRGLFQTPVQIDVAFLLRHWHFDDRIKINLYSGCRTDACRHFLTHTNRGDLNDCITEYFDTRIGTLDRKETYEKIVQNSKAPPEDVLFLTNVVDDAITAKKAGISVLYIAPYSRNLDSISADEKALPWVNKFTEIIFLSDVLPAKNLPPGTTSDDLQLEKWTSKHKIQRSSKHRSTNHHFFYPRKISKKGFVSKSQIVCVGKEASMMSPADRVRNAIEKMKNEISPINQQIRITGKVKIPPATKTVTVRRPSKGAAQKPKSGINKKDSKPISGINKKDIKPTSAMNRKDSRPTSGMYKKESKPTLDLKDHQDHRDKQDKKEVPITFFKHPTKPSDTKMGDQRHSKDKPSLGKKSQIVKAHGESKENVNHQSGAVGGGGKKSNQEAGSRTSAIHFP